MVLLAICLSACATVAPARASTLEADDAASLEASLVDALARSEGVGLSVSVVKNGSPVLVKAFGLRSRAPDQPVLVDTPFAIASLTKQLTAACVLMLVDEGRLSVSDPISRWFPLATRAADITVLDLMHHVSGYRDYYPLDFVDHRLQTPTAVDEIIARYTQRPLDFEPGTRFSYSNTGYLMLGRVVELISGQRLGAFLEQRLFRPLGMTHSTYERPVNEQRAVGYTRFALGPTVEATPEAAQWLGGAAAVWSTPTDLARWSAALMGGRVLKPESLWLMTGPRRLKGGAMTRYGGGVNFSILDGQLTVDHTGALNGFRSATLFDDKGTSVVLLSNFDDLDPGDLAEEIFEKVRLRPGLVSVAGPSITEAARSVFEQLQTGTVNRALFTDEFAQFLSEARLSAAKAALAPYGQPLGVKAGRPRERGALEVVSVRFTFTDERSLIALMYRRADGLIEEFLVLPSPWVQ